MKLIYRGVEYDNTSESVNLSNSHLTTTTLKYRGNAYRTNQAVDMTLPGMEADLTYRGSHYHVNLGTGLWAAS